MLDHKLLKEIMNEREEKEKKIRKMEHKESHELFVDFAQEFYSKAPKSGRKIKILLRLEEYNYVDFKRFKKMLYENFELYFGLCGYELKRVYQVSGISDYFIDLKRERRRFK